MKSMKNIQTLALALLAALALAVPVAVAQTGNTNQSNPPERGAWRGREQRGHQGGRGFGWLGRLNLTDAQKAQMKQLRQSFRDRTQALRQALRAKHQELRQASEGNSFNEGLATQQLTEMASLRAKLMGERFKLRQETLALLTPEQKTQLEQAREQFKAKREQFRAKRAERKAQQ